jgi:hypothetical protein
MNKGPGSQDDGSMLNPKRMSPVESVDFCGACHRTPVDVAAFMQANLAIAKVRFQPARLERSLCWGSDGDPRITCIACHDPHKPLERDATAYDSKCLACHAGFGAEPSPGQGPVARPPEKTAFRATCRNMKSAGSTEPSQIITSGSSSPAPDFGSRRTPSG